MLEKLFGGAQVPLAPRWLRHCLFHN